MASSLPKAPLPAQLAKMTDAKVALVLVKKFVLHARLLTSRMLIVLAQSVLMLIATSVVKVALPKNVPPVLLTIY